MWYENEMQDVLGLDLSFLTYILILHKNEHNKRYTLLNTAWCLEWHQRNIFISDSIIQIFKKMRLRNWANWRIGICLGNLCEIQHELKLDFFMTYIFWVLNIIFINVHLFWCNFWTTGFVRNPNIRDKAEIEIYIKLSLVCTLHILRMRLGLGRSSGSSIRWALRGTGGGTARSPKHLAGEVLRAYASWRSDGWNFNTKQSNCKTSVRSVSIK